MHHNRSWLRIWGTQVKNLKWKIMIKLILLHKTIFIFLTLPWHLDSFRNFCTALITKGLERIFQWNKFRRQNESDMTAITYNSLICNQWIISSRFCFMLVKLGTTALQWTDRGYLGLALGKLYYNTVILPIRVNSKPRDTPQSHVLFLVVINCVVLKASVLFEWTSVSELS